MFNSMRGLAEHRVEVCIAFRGSQEVCRTAAGATVEEATRKAKDNACAFVASGVTDSLACSNTTPTRVTPLDDK
jgi:hypothetical protein